MKLNVDDSEQIKNNNKENQENEDMAKNNNTLKEILCQINMQKYIDIFIESGFNYINLIIEQAQKGIYIKNSELKEASNFFQLDKFLK